MTTSEQRSRNGIIDSIFETVITSKPGEMKPGSADPYSYWVIPPNGSPHDPPLKAYHCSDTNNIYSRLSLGRNGPNCKER